MTTRDTIENYFRALSAEGNWQAFLADGITFTSHGNPRKEVTGRGAYVESTRWRSISTACPSLPEHWTVRTL